VSEDENLLGAPMENQDWDILRKLKENSLNLDSETMPDKRMPLANAVAQFVRPGMALHLLTTHNRSGACVYELCRRFRGKNPGFTVSSLGIVSTVLALIHCGVVKKVVTTFGGDAYPTPAPNAIIQRALDEGKLEIENWTILTFPLRLMAGAFGIPYLPVRSVVGSDMAKENREWFEAEPGAEFGKLKAYRPDLTMVQAIAADASGNAILTPPYGEDAYGAWAAKDGVIVCCERVVPTELIRRYSHLVKIPSARVLAVCEVPFGAHPGGMSNQGIKELDTYADDYDFLEELRLASKSKEKTDEWCEKYVFGWKDWEDYLSRIGKTRLWSLKGKASQDSWHSELIELWDKIDFSAPAGAMEWMIAAAGRKISERLAAEKYSTILAGVGASNLSAWLGYYRERSSGSNVQLIAEIGFYGYQPRPADPFIFNYRNIPTCKMLAGIETVMGVFMGGAAARCIGVIGAGQVDRQGNINSTRIGKTYLVGSGGANDIAMSAGEVLVTAIQDKFRFVENVSYITSPGKRVRTVVTNLGVFEKQGEGLVLSGYFDRGKPEKESVDELKANCGWALQVRDRLDKISGPTQDELNLIRIFDPRRQFLGKR
jgi:acyl CoA:acetate/3-ketoacid CoA transferase alpha subunit/acyl CoA:acetate/3-ketoacid CoA transferase beta subunit